MAHLCAPRCSWPPEAQCWPGHPMPGGLPGDWLPPRPGFLGSRVPVSPSRCGAPPRPNRSVCVVGVFLPGQRTPVFMNLSSNQATREVSGALGPLKAAALPIQHLVPTWCLEWWLQLR